MEYKTADGNTFTDADIEGWCEHYEQGSFLPNSKVTKVMDGKPQHSSAKSATITLKVPEGMKVALKNRAKEEGMTTSAYIRNALLRASL